jgi:hypothetical protein
MCESGLAELSVTDGKSSACPKKSLRICAAWTALMSEASNAVNVTCRSKT